MGLESHEPDNLCGQKVLAFGADRTELVPTANVACGLQPAQVWHPVTNPTGERCGIADFMRAVFGVTVTPDAPNGKGKLAIDNVGVQYGLVALTRGQLTPEQFVDLNTKVGGIDIDGNFTAARSVADPDALRIAYETGRVNSATGAANIPEIDNRTGAQMDDTGFHPAFHSFTYRARLDRSNGNHDNQVIWLSRTGGTVPNQFDAMRRWLDTGEKPAEGCFMAGGVRGDLSCNGTWTAYGNPLHQAGVPYTLDVVKCQLRPLARADYPVSLSDAQSANAPDDVPERRLRLLATRCEPGPAEGPLADVRGRSGRPRTRERAERRRVRAGYGRRDGAGDAVAGRRARPRSGRSRRASRASTRRTRPRPSRRPRATRRSRSPSQATSPTARSPCPSRCAWNSASAPGRRRPPARPSPSRSSSSSSPPTRCGRAPTRGR